jgi:hypothetical protein
MRLAALCLLLLLSPSVAHAAPEEQDATTTGLAQQPRVHIQGLPLTERRGDDLIIHYRLGDAGVTLPGYMKDVADGDTKVVTMPVDGHGTCFLALDSAGSIVRAKCDQ